ncbi:MAG: serine hydrolase [Planctomycetaceae bacterium]|nr:serine hydrolase [Planctomycetaceae bacterium]
MIRRYIAFTICIFCAFPSANVIAQEAASTIWKGELDGNGQRLRLELELRHEGGTLSGQIRSVDQNNQTMKLTDLILNDKQLAFVIPQVGAQFNGTISVNGDKAEGVFKQGRGSMPLVFTKFESAAVIPETDINPLEELAETVQWYVEKKHIVGGELLIIDKEKVVFHKSFGFSDREDQRLWENNQLCNIRSMSKPITSAAAQILIDQERLDLDSPVARYLTSFDNERSNMITVRQVLTHRSGLPLTNLLKPDQFENLATQVATMAKAGPQFEPGSKFWYSDIGTDVVAALVEEITGELLNDFVQRELFEPLGMSHTLYGIDASDPRLKQAASLYLRTPSKSWQRFWTPEKPLYPFAWGSQTIYSTTSDYAKFLRMLMNGGRVGDRQLLSTDAVARMLEPVSRMKRLGSDSPYPTGYRELEVYYGQMVVTHRPKGEPQSPPIIIGHSGSDGTNAWAMPERDLVILYFTQSRGGSTAIRIETSLDRLLLHPGKTEPIPEALKPYVGKFVANYGNFDNEIFTISVREGKLMLDVPSQMQFELLDPDENNRWAFKISPQRVQAEFTRNAKGEVIGMKLHKSGNVFEVPRQGSDRDHEIAAEKKARESVKATADGETLKAAWVGTLDINGMKPVMQFRIMDNENGTTTAYFDSLTEGAKNFTATWSQKDDQLTFEVAKIKLTYRGTLNASKNTAVGKWSQGGRTLPLTLTKRDKAQK